MTGTRPGGGRLLRRVVVYPLAALAVVVGGAVGAVLATMQRAGPPHRGVLALTGATVLAGEDLAPLEDAVVLVRDGTIVTVGARGDVAVPSEAVTLDLDGATLLPGLVDLHVHLAASAGPGGGGDDPVAVARTLLDWVRFVPGTRRSLLDHGVTTVRSAGDPHEWVTDLRRQVRDGELEGPRVLTAGPLFTAPGGHPVATLFAGDEAAVEQVRLPGTPDEARRMVRAIADGERRVDFVKVVQDRGGPPRRLEPIAPDVLEAVVDEAHAQDLRVFGHWGTAEDLADLLAAGVDGLEHVGRLPAGWPEGSLGTLVADDVSVTPTLAVSAVRLPPAELARHRQRVRDLHAAGGRVVAGSDAGMPGVGFGPGLHRELALLVDSGLSPRQALRAATSEAARVLGSDRVGVIAPGRAADLLVVDGDPLSDVRAAARVVMVFRDGRTVVDRRGR